MLTMPVQAACMRYPPELVLWLRPEDNGQDLQEDEAQDDVANGAVRSQQRCGIDAELAPEDVA